MSRYLKTATAAVYRNKKTYLVPGNYTFNVPFTSNEVKVMVFGGGGNAKLSCVNTVGSNGSHGFQVGAASGPGGGFAEKLYTGVAGSSACIVLGTCEANSSFCISGAGTTLATGGRLVGGCGTPWCHCYGVGSGGDVNRCGSCGQTQCLCFFCCVSGCTCVMCYTVGAWVAGGSPGNSVNNGVVDTLSITTGGNYSNFNCVRGQYYGYGCTKCNECRFMSVNGSYTRGYGCCPVSSATYYGFDWDVVGGDSCPTSNFTLASGCAWCTLPSNSDSYYVGCNCCVSCTIGAGCFGTPCCGGSISSGYIGEACCNFLRYQKLIPCLCTSACQTAGVTGSGGPGACGGVGGGGGGVFLNPHYDTWYYAAYYINPYSHPAGCLLQPGGTGLVIVYY